MATDKTQGLQTRGGATSLLPPRPPGPGVVLTPPVDIFEDSQAITVLADMPGVTPGQLTIDLHEGVLAITGHADAPERPNEVAVLGEYRTGATFQRSWPSQRHRRPGTGSSRSRKRSTKGGSRRR